MAVFVGAKVIVRGVLPPTSPDCAHLRSTEAKRPRRYSLSEELHASLICRSLSILNSLYACCKKSETVTAAKTALINRVTRGANTKPKPKVAATHGAEHHGHVTKSPTARCPGYYGGAMKIAPELDDGFFDVITIADASAFRILANSPGLYFATHLRIDEVGHTLAKRVVARPAKKDDGIAVELDGEISTACR